MTTPPSTVADGVRVPGTSVVASVIRSDSTTATPVTVVTTPVTTPANSGSVTVVSSSSTAGK